MEVVPAPLLAEVMYYLTPTEVLCCFASISKACYQVWQEGYYQERYLAGLLKVTEEVNLRYVGLGKVIKGLAEGEAQTLRFVGLGTNGGVDNDTPYYWVDGAFKGPSGSGYSSREGKNNINVLAGFCPPRVSSPCIEAAKQTIARAFRSSHILRFLGRRLHTTEELCDRELMVFVRLWEQRPEVFLISVPREDWEQSRLVINNALRTLLDDYISITDLHQSRENSMVLLDTQKLHEVQHNPILALVKKVIISREGEYTCPVRSFLLFYSLDYIDVDGDDLRAFDGLKTPEMVETVGSAGDLVDRGEWIGREIHPGDKKIKPVMWVQFKPRGKRAEITFKFGVICRFLYLKLVDCDNRMEEMGDPNAQTNIDLGMVQIYGCPLALA